MALRIYLMPIIGDGSKLDPRRPKYADTHLSGFSWQAMDYGDEPTCIVASDLGAGHAALAAEVDVTAVPSDLNQIVGAQLSTVQSTLEGFNIPAGWINSNHTYRRVLRVVSVLFQISQRYQGKLFGRIFTSGVTLNTQFSDLPDQARARLLEVSNSFGFDTSGLTGSSTLRQILKEFVDQFVGPIVFGDNSLER